MPFITEELWSVTAEGGPLRDDLLTLTPWPAPAGARDEEAEAEIGWVIDLVAAVRSVKAEMNISATEIPLVLAGASELTQARATRWADVIKRIARLSTLSMAQPAARLRATGGARRGCGIAAQRSGRFCRRAGRLQKELTRVEADIARVDGKLGNADFVRRAPEEVVESRA